MQNVRARCWIWIERSSIGGGSPFGDGIGTELLGKLFSEDDIRVFDPRSAVFHCRCSRDRAANVLKLLGEEECELTGDDEAHIVVTCEYCGSQESFDPVDIAAIFADGSPAPSPSVH